MRRNKEVYLLVAVFLISFAMICQCSVLLTESNGNNGSESLLNSDPLNPCAGTITYYHPSAGTSWTAGTSLKINWTSSGVSAYVNIILLKNGVLYSVIAWYTPNTNDVFNSYNWTIPVNTPYGITYRIQIADNIDPENTYVIGPSFTILNVSWIIVDIPNSFSNWVAGSAYNIYWSSNMSGLVNIDLYQNGIYKGPIQSALTNTGVYTWDIPDSESAGSDYQVRISDYNTGLIVGISDEFSITVPGSGIPGFAWEYAILALGIGVAIMITLMERKHNLQIIA